MVFLSEIFALPSNAHCTSHVCSLAGSNQQWKFILSNVNIHYSKILIQIFAELHRDLFRNVIIMSLLRVGECRMGMRYS